jgi:D-alanyl-D-alanine carboxypeptidase/D-alanyl-D-alanine-endopeptidase (penicillin-binding protein 4)
MIPRAVWALVAVAALGGCARASHASQLVHRARVTRPVAAPAWTSAQLRTLATGLDAVTGAMAVERLGVAVAAPGGDLLYGVHADRPLAPASTFKTLVAATALDTLGVGARLSTDLEALAEPGPDGTVGDVWLVGGGDPVLTHDDLRGGVAALVRAGVRRIAGDVVVDASAFTGPEQNPAWAPEDFSYGYGAGTSAVSLDWDVEKFTIEPTQIGVPARVHVEPPDPDVVVHGAPLTAGTTLLDIEREPDRNDFTIDGRIAEGIQQSFYRPVVDVPHWVGEAALAMLRERGVAVEGGVREGVEPLAARTLWQHESPPLRTLVRTMLVESDNHIAEQLLRVIGTRANAEFRGADGSEAAGARVERAYLLRLGVPLSGLRIIDGSGLAASDRIAPLTLVRLLQATQRTGIAQAYVDAFPRVGVEGTVKFHQLTDAAGRVRAKSGHIGGVAALAGYVETRHHGRIAFAFIANGAGSEDIDERVDRALDLLSRS